MTPNLALPTLVALCSIALSRPVQSAMVVLGEMSIGGSLMKIEELANTLQVCLDSGAKKILMPAVCMTDLASVPTDLATSFDFILYKSAEEAVIKALGN
jgi:ATP-dependent Lon protease